MESELQLVRLGEMVGQGIGLLLIVIGVVWLIRRACAPHGTPRADGHRPSAPAGHPSRAPS